MELIDQYLLIAFVFTVLYGVIVAQAIQLSRLLRSAAWWLLAGGFICAGGRLLWNLLRLPAAIVKAQGRGQMPDTLTTEQYILIGAAFIALCLWIAGFDRLRRDLKKVGV